MVRPAAAVAVMAACSWGGGLDGPFSCPDGRCPAGLECRAGLCVAPGGAPDADPGCEGGTRDDFEAALDPARWTVAADPTVTVATEAGRLAIAYVDEETAGEARMVERLPLEGFAVTVEVIAPSDVSSSFIRLRLYDEDPAAPQLSISADTFVLVAAIDPDTGGGQDLRSDTYQPQLHRFWRVARVADEVCFSTSETGAAFTEYACASTDGIRARLRAALAAGNYAGVEPQSARFDEFRWCPP